MAEHDRLIHALDLDFQQRGNVQKLYAVQNEINSRSVIINFLNGGTAWSAPTDADMSAVMSFSKPDGTQGEYDTLPDGSPAYTWNANRSAVTLKLAPQMFTCAGAVHCAVKLVYTETAQVYCTFRFDLVLDRDTIDSTRPSEGYFNVKSLGELYAEIDAVRTENKGLESELAKLSGLVENLTVAADGNLYTITVDSSAAYVKTVPANALPVANVDAIGGLTKLVDGQLVNADVMRITSAGIESKAVPDALRQIEGWGVGFSSVLYNALRGTKFVRKFVVVVLDGSNVISRSSASGVSYVNLQLPSPPMPNSAHAIDNYNDRMPGGSAGTSGSVRFVSGYARRFDNAYTSTDEAKRLLNANPLILMYELAEEQEVDCSGIISADFSQLHVAANGSIVFEQANGTLHDIHSEVTYAIKIGG